MDATSRAVVAASDTDWNRLAEQATDDADPKVRAVALAALVRGAPRPVSAPVWKATARDVDARVRLRAAQVAPALGRSASQRVLLDLLADADAWVAEAAAFALGERPAPGKRALDALVHAAGTHDDPL